MYVRFPLSLRNVEDLLFERGIDVCHENRAALLEQVRAALRRRRSWSADSCMPGFRHWRWHLDEMYVKINGAMRYLWRAVDHQGEVLESFVTTTRDKKAALTMRKTLKRH